MNDRLGIVGYEMSHSLREILRDSRRFDTFACAYEIAKSVSRHFLKSRASDDIVYTYDGDCIEAFQNKTTIEISNRLEGQFFDMFPDIDIEVRISIDNTVDIDGLYYHTPDDEDAGLIEICVKLSKKYAKNIRQDHLISSIQSILVHEMQHVVQRCFLGLDLACAPEPYEHLINLCEIDARIEEVMCGMIDESNVQLFSDRMERYLDEFYLRNKASISNNKRAHILKDPVSYTHLRAHET